MNLVRASRGNRYAVYLITVLLFGAGLWAIFQLPSNIYPELNFPRIMILAHSGDLPPDTELISVTRPLEQAAMSIQGVYRVRSKTIRGASEISVLFTDGSDMAYSLQLLQGSVNEVRSDLPPDTEVQVERVSPTVFPVMSFIVNGDVPGADLRDEAYYVLRPMVSRVTGVGIIEVQATDTRQIQVIVDPQKASAHRLSLVDIADRLKATNEVTSVGKLPKDYLQYLILTTSQFTTLDQIRNTVVDTQGSTPVHLSDVAVVKDGVEDRTILVTGNGKPAALINVSRQLGGNILQIGTDLNNLMANLGDAIPKTLHISLVYDLAQFVRDSIDNVRDAILIGAVLAVLILLAFLREGRTTLIAALSLPLSVVSTFFFVKLLGGTLNLMSLGGLAIAIGIIIDDAVVVIENIYRHLGMGETPALAAEKGTAELIGPVVGSTATTLVVFLPLGLLTGFVGDFFRSLCMTLSVSIMLSLVFALTLIPLLSERFLSAKSYKHSAGGFIEPVNRAYERAVHWALRRRIWIVALTLVTIVAGVFLYTKLESDFLPDMDEGGFVLDYITPPGTSLQETDSIVRKFEDRIAKLPETAAFSRRTGAEMGLYATQQNKGDILVKLVPLANRKRSTEDIMDYLRPLVQQDAPGVEIEFTQILQDMLGDLQGVPEPVEVKLFGDNLTQLEEVADDVGAKMQKIEGIVDYKGNEKGNPEIVFHVDPTQTGRLGLNTDQVTQQVSAGLLGVTETQLRQADRTIDIRVRFPDEFRYNVNNIEQFPIVTPGKQVVPLSALATIEHVQGENQLLRENQRLMISLTARLENRDLGSTMADVQTMMNGIKLPTGMTYEIGGQYEAQQQSFKELLGVVGLALAAVFIVLVIQFKQFAPALIILSAAPLSLLGVFGMLLVTGTPLNVSSMMGIILMVGLVVKNGIILFQYVAHLRKEEHMPLDVALATAGRIRVRPILMTTLATLFGLLPLALGLGSGAELQKPLALAVIGGLLLSTFITLFVMPVMYSFFERRRAGSGSEPVQS
ncbi:MAG TPA: efflux RND transporter permease subunit [Candidatus Acidoferrales bacterium]|jgi:CzcA family heavy metal efflux pump|nr:efflux RND transporter permease subunit [Candidatus Acidoferrales bacterium]